MPRPNILLILWDSVRAANCSLYDHDNETTPFLTDFAADATVFDQARSPSIHSISSHTSIFTGFHTEEHGIRDHSANVSPESTIWKELETEYGYDTGLFTPNAVVARSSNLNESFGTDSGPTRNTGTLFDDGLSHDSVPGGTFQYISECLKHESVTKSLANGFYSKFFQFGNSHDPESESAGAYTQKLLDWVQNRSKPWAACLNLMDAHYPYVPDEDHDLWGGDKIQKIGRDLSDNPLSETFLKGAPYGQLRALESLYDGCIKQLDHSLKGLVDYLKRIDEYEDTLIVVTSDHGEGFGERSRLTPQVRMIDHSWGIHEHLTHVPLIVKEPKSNTSKRTSEVATLTRFPAAVHAAVDGQTAATEFVPPDGRVLSSTFRIEEPGDSLPIPESERGPYFGPWRAVYENHKEISGAVMKYAANQSNRLQSEIYSAQESRVVGNDIEVNIERIFKNLEKKHVGGKEKANELSSEVEEHLADLGYLRGES